MSSHHIGQRLAFDGALCTVRYIGPVVGTQKDWLGVEWDDIRRGKHDGEHQGKRYFSCRSKSNSAASFIRPSRTPDTTKDFIEAVTSKYATGIIESRGALATDLRREIEISGKIAYEVGFDKIRMQQRQLDELKIVFVDAMRVDVASSTSELQVRDVCPRIVELGLSRNLFENCEQIVKICGDLQSLKSLVLNGNRIQVSDKDLRMGQAKQAFTGIQTLSLDEMIISWEDTCLLSSHFPSLTSLSASLNEFSTLPVINGLPTLLPSLESLTLEYNDFTSLYDLSPLASLPHLQRLFLKGNSISSIANSSDTAVIFGPQLTEVDLSYNAVSSWAFVDDLPDAFPGLVTLRLSNNPVYTAAPALGSIAISADETFMLTLARLGNLQTLNFSKISSAERTNAEMFYLSRIGRALATAPQDEEHTVSKQHRRYAELCELYGEPAIIRAETINPNFLEARLIKFNFRLNLGEDSQSEKIQEIPKGFDVYQLKGVVGKLFELQPFRIKLIWETGDFDPVAGYEDEEESEDEDSAPTKEGSRAADRGKWMKREMELEDGTRQIGNTIDAKEAVVRIELR